MIQPTGERETIVMQHSKMKQVEMNLPVVKVHLISEVEVEAVVEAMMEDEENPVVVEEEKIASAVDVVDVVRALPSEAIASTVPEVVVEVVEASAEDQEETPRTAILQLALLLKSQRHPLPLQQKLPRLRVWPNFVCSWQKGALR